MKNMSKYVDIVFDGPPSHESGRFVEVENDKGASIRFGEWVECGEYWCLRIKLSDFPHADGYVVMQNTDRTEGRGEELPITVTLNETVAVDASKGQGVMGSDAHIKRAAIFYNGAQPYGPVKLHKPSNHQIQRTQELEAKSAVISKAKDLGLTQGEIDTLSGVHE